MRSSLCLVGIFLAIAPAALAQDNLPNLSTVAAPDGAASSTAESSAAPSSAPQSTNAPQSSAAPSPTNNNAFPTVVQPGNYLSGLPTLAGAGIPSMVVPNTAGAPFMQKSDLPDGTVFICVGAILAFFAAGVLAWRGLVAWSLHRSVKRAAVAQNMADMKAMSAVPGKKRGMYNVVGANSTMSLDHLAAAPMAKSSKPYAQQPAGTPPGKSASSLFFSPTAGGAAGLRDSVNRSSSYLPAGYYAAGNAAPAQGSPMTHVGGQGNLSAMSLAGNLSANSLDMPGNRFSHRSGMSPTHSPSLPPSRGTYDRAPPSRDGLSTYGRNSSATLGQPRDTRSGVYGHNDNMSQLSLNVPGGNATGGRAPSAYLEDLFENHGSGPRERF